MLAVGRCRRPSGDSPGFRLRSASLACGELVAAFLQGSTRHSRLVREALSFLVLPGQGIGHDRLLGERLNLTAGESLGSLPLVKSRSPTASPGAPS